MSEERQLLKEVSSGKIEIIWNGVFSRVEMNCSCLDAIPICKGMCCRSKVGFSVELEEDEIGKYHQKVHPTRSGVMILAKKADGLSCHYFDEEKSLCSIHKTRPKMCRRWHCSPGGQPEDQEIERRDAGWMLLPVRKEEADFVQYKETANGNVPC